MALNPEEVVNKRFSATKFRQGYDEEEVDEFLDEVVAELRRLNGENEELRTKLRTCESRVAELSRGGSSKPTGTTAPAPVTAAATASTAPATETAPAPEAAPATETAPAPEATPATAAAPAPAPSGVEGAAGMLALAQRLHDEHVEAGKAQGAKLLSEAQEHAARLIREAEDEQRSTLGNLQTQRQALESSVDELRSFEREYRSRLKAYLQSQLHDLESQVAPSGG